MIRIILQFSALIFILLNNSLITKAQDQFGDSLIKSELIQLDSLNGEGFWGEIIKKNQGTVIYGNLCGSWCKGCIQSFSTVEAHRKRYEGKNLVYVYLWAGSNEKKATALIEEYQLEGQHYWLSDGQLKYLQNKLNNRGFPAYFLVDINGQLYKRVAASPGDEHSIKQIDELIQSSSLK